MKKANSLFVKIFVMSVICMIVPMLISLVYISFSASNSMEEKIKNSLSSVTLEKSNEISLAFDDISKTTQQVATQPYVIEYFKELTKNKQADPSKTKSIEKYINDLFHNANGVYENVFFGYEEKTLIDGIGGMSVGHVYTDNQEPWYKTVMGSPKAYIGNTQASPVSGRPNTILAYPVIDPDSKQIMATFTCAVALEKMAENLVKSNPIDHSKTFLIDSSGKVLGAEDSSQILKLDFSKEKGDIQDFYKQVKGNNSGIGYFTLNGSRNIAAYKKVEKFDMYVINFMPVTQFTAEVNKLQKGIILVMSSSIVIFAFVIFLFSRGIVKPIKLAIDHMKIIASGDFSMEVSAKAMKNRDETGVLMRTIDSMQKSIRDIISTVVQESKEVEEAAMATNEVVNILNCEIEEVTATTEEMSSTMEETAATTEEINGTSNKLEVSVKSITDKAKSGADASTLISKRAQELKESAIISQKTAEEISEYINTNMREAIEQSKAVDKINELTEAILQIASQTDLLALNAAIEAARAGEAGKGFAVVADEVRKLAENSKGTVTEIQQVTKLVVEAVDNLQQNSERVLDFIDTKVIKDYRSMVQTGEQYYEDAEFVENLVSDFSVDAQKLNASMVAMANSMNQISISNTEAAEGAQSITEKITSVLEKSNTVTDIASRTKESSEKLKDVVSKFKV